MDKTPGRYNLHKLGWKAFEDLIIEVNRTILGPGVTPFRVGADEGRDGFFKGQVVGMYATAAPTAKTVTFQCKHTATPGGGLTPSVLAEEEVKIKALAQKGEADIFAIFTNRRVSSEHKRDIRARFEGIEGVQACLVCGEEFLEPFIDQHYQLRRRVPRLFGVGDLSQILSHSVSEQTRALLEENQAESAVFAPTPSYRRAVDAMEAHRMAVLVGPPASGKSAIALNLCMWLGAEEQDLEVVRIETAEQFTDCWSVGDTRKLFWVDDFFGETTYDDQRAKPWAAVNDKVVAAWKTGVRFIFTCRDYVLEDASSRIKKRKLDFIKDHRVFVKVDDLNATERQKILYNHIKLGDLTQVQKQRLKPFLYLIAGLTGFTPEIARRLGSRRFHAKLSYDTQTLRSFVEHPVHFFKDVIEDLGTPEKATIALLLLSNNSLPDPVVDIPRILKTAYDVTTADIRQALKRLDGSLTRLGVLSKHRVWQVHHPSMIDAMHEILHDNSTMLDLFLTAAPPEVVMRDCSTQEREHCLFVPSNLYDILLRHVMVAEPRRACRFLLDQTDEFLRFAIATAPGDCAPLLAKGVEPLGRHFGLDILQRIHAYDLPGVAQCKAAIEEGLPQALWIRGCWRSLRSDDFPQLLDEERIRDCLSRFSEYIDACTEEMIDAVKHGHADFNRAEDAREEVERFFRVLIEEAERWLYGEEFEELQATAEEAKSRILRDVDDYLRSWAQYEEDGYDRWRDEKYEREAESRSDIFADVDQ